MEIVIKKNSENIHLIELAGDMDLGGSEKLKDLLMNLIKNRIKCFIINLKRVTNMDSTGIGALIFVSSTLKKFNCPLVIIVPDGPVMQALEVTKMKNYFVIARSVKEALVLASPKKKKS